MQWPPTPGPGVERLEAERLGGGAVDRVPQVHAELVAEDRHLVHQRDVDVPVGVLEQLGHLGLAGGLRLDDRVADGAVEVRRRVGAGRGEAADHLGGVADAVDLVARVDPLRGERQVEVDPGGQPGRLLQHRADDLVGGARVGGRLEDDQRARLEYRRGGLGRGLDRGQVRAVGLRQRGRDADHGHVGRVVAGQLGQVGGGAEAALDHRLDVAVGQVVDVAAAGVQAVHRRGLDVIAGYVQADPDGLLGQRQAHVAKPDDHDVHETDLLEAATFNRSVAAA